MLIPNLDAKNAIHHNFKGNCNDHFSYIRSGNKIGKVYFLEYTEIPKVFFMPHTGGDVS
jgi:hypothetical protein